jgi:hypothetical protein
MRPAEAGLIPTHGRSRYAGCDRLASALYRLYFTSGSAFSWSLVISTMAWSG